MQGIERALWFGQRAETTRNGEPQRTTGGVVSFIASANKVNAETDYPAGLTMEGLEEYLRQIFTYGSSEKMGFLGNHAMLVLQQVIRRNSSYQIQGGLKEFGMNVSRLVCPFGELVLKTHTMFNQAPGGTTTGTAYYGLSHRLIVLDMAQLQYVYMDGSDTQYEADLTPKGLDGKKSGYLTECGIQVATPLAHFQISALNEAAVDA